MDVSNIDGFVPTGSGNLYSSVIQTNGSLVFGKWYPFKLDLSPNTLVSVQVSASATGSAGVTDCFLEGIVPYNGDRNSGISVDNLAHWGTTSNYISTENGLASNIDRFCEQGAILFIVNWATNDCGTGATPTTDYATYKARLQTVVKRAASKGACVLFNPPPSRNDSAVFARWAAYLGAMYEVADDNRQTCAVADEAAWTNNDSYIGEITKQGWAGNGTHYGDRKAVFESDYLASILTQQF